MVFISLILKDREKNKVFVTLPHVIGHKYLFCRHCPGREPGTEFVLLYNKEEDKEGVGEEEGHFHCQITCEEGGCFWITQVKCPTLLNEQPVRIVRGSLIKDGDIVQTGRHSFRVVIERIGKEEEEEKDEDKQVGEVEEVHSDPQFNPLDNPLILSKVMSLLPRKDLKKCRRVSSLWNSHATPPLLKESQLCFNFTQAIEEWVDPNIWIKFWQYINSPMAGLKHPNWQILLTTKKQGAYASMITWTIFFPIPPEDWMSKLCADIEYFFSPRMNLDFISNLQLSVKSHWDKDYDEFFIILRKLGPNLTDLWIEICHKDDSAIPRVPQDIKFPKLEKFKFGIMDCRTHGLQCINFPETLALAMQGTSLKSLFLMSMPINNIDINAAFFLSATFSNLVEVEMRESTYPLISAILKLDQPLKTLGLGIVYEQFLELCQTLIHKHSPTLENLTILLPQEEETKNKKRSNPCLKLPPMPRLLKLEIMYEIDGDKQNCRRVFSLQMESHITVDYERDFPNLRSLYLVPWAQNLFGMGTTWQDRIWRPYERTLNIFWAMFNRYHLRVFFPSLKPAQVFKNLRRLDLPVIFGNTVWSEDGKRIADMFPSVFSPMWNEVRD